MKTVKQLFLNVEKKTTKPYQKCEKRRKVKQQYTYKSQNTENITKDLLSAKKDETLAKNV